MKTLYVDRQLLNPIKLREWAKEQLGCECLKASDMHVTVAFSKEEVDWNKITPRDKEIHVEVEKAYPEPLGDKGAVVLKFKSDVLEKRWQHFRDKGASWDYEGYQPHVTITYSYEGDKAKLKNVKPFSGRFRFGPERHKEVDLDWTEKIEED